MLYMPVTTAATPVVLQDTQQSQSHLPSRYYVIQPSPIVPGVPVLNTTLVYPRYGFVPKPVETSVTKEDIEKSQNVQLVQPVPTTQHVIHHHVQTCPGYCNICFPGVTLNQSSTLPPVDSNRQQSRCSCRDVYQQTDDRYEESIEERIERIRRELALSSTYENTQTNPIIEHHIHHRPRSTSRPRSASATREPWRSSNQNDYPWRDAHLPAYREATLTRSKTPDNQSLKWEESAHERSHRNTQHSTSYNSKKEFIYRPKSEAEARKWYTQTTGKNPDSEVYQSLRGGTTTYKYNEFTTPQYYDRQQSTKYETGFYSAAPVDPKVHTLRKIDSTQYHNLYACNDPCLHVVPKQGNVSDPPYMKILNAPVTYIH